ESFSHPFGMDQRLELKPRARAVRLGLPGIVKVRKFIFLPEREQESRLGGETCRFEARSFSPGLQRSEIDVRGQVLLAGRSIKIFAGAMVLISKKSPAHVVIVEQIGGRMAVIDGEHIAALEAAADFTDPVARFQSRFGVLALAQSDALHRKIF